jgi:hypothetical protein
VTEPSALFRNVLKRSPIRDGDRRSVDSHPPRPLPFVQALINPHSPDDALIFGVTCAIQI